MGCFYARSFEASPVSTLQSVVNSKSSLYTSLRNATMPDPPESSGAFQSLLSSAYDPQVQEAWTTCGVARNWGWYYLLSALPFTIRFVQSLRRYRDSKLPTHLINVRNFHSFLSLLIIGFLIGRQIWDGFNILLHLLLLEASRWVRVSDTVVMYFKPFF